MITGVLLPTLILGTLAVVVTRGIERLMPETMLGIFLTTVLSGLAVWVLASLGFALLYRLEDPAFVAALGTRVDAGVAHFLGLGAKAALIWGPLVALVCVTSPRRWRTNTW